MSVRIDADLRTKVGNVRDQRTRPTCLVFAVTAAHEVARQASEYLSTEYLFFAGVQRSHRNPNRGLSTNAVTEALRDEGQPVESSWPYLQMPPDAKNWKPPVVA